MVAESLALRPLLDLRKSPPLRLLELLKQKCKVDYYDPMVRKLDIGGLKMDSIQLTPTKLKKYDCVVIAVDHTHVDYALIARHAKLVFDAKNVFRGTEFTNVRSL